MIQDKQHVWKCGKHSIHLDRPRIMGVLNVTPDSFSDGGAHNGVDQAVEHALDMLDQGADIIDVGGESTRPGFTPVSIDEEAQRVVPVVRELVKRGVVVSIDTRHPEVAEICVKLGASIINDVEGFSNPKMIEVAAKSSVGCVVMHAGSAATPSHHTHVRLDSSHKDDELNQVMSASQASYAGAQKTDTDALVRRVYGFLADHSRMLEKAGVSADRICIDPGAGFGKGAEEDLVLHQSFKRLQRAGYPVMCAISRKRMTGFMSGALNPQDRDATTAGMCVGALELGARIVRVHNVKVAREVIDGYWTTVHPNAKKALVALGSNVGNCVGYLEAALSKMQDIPLTKVTRTSHAYDTEPAYGLATSVVDAVCEIETSLPPLVLLKQLQSIEDELGRIRIHNPQHSGPRTIDLDLLWMEGEIHAGRILELPHPRMGERDFVIRPMKDLMSSPEKFIQDAGVSVAALDERVGKVTEDLGPLKF